MKFHLNDTSLRNMTHTTSIQNKNFSVLCSFLAEISMNFHSKDTSLRNMTCNSSIPNHNSSIQSHNFMNFLLIVSWNWVWNFIQRIPPWDIWRVTLQFKIISLQFKIKISWIYCWLLVEIEYEISFKWHLLEKYDT